MLSHKTKGILFTIILFGYFLIVTAKTSADLFDEDIIRQNKLKMTTLALSQRNTANNNKIPSLFNISSIKPGGFSVGAVRITNDGQADFKYRLKTTFPGGLTTLCQALDVEVWQERETKFQGKLKDLVLDQNLNSQNRNNWIIFVKLDQNTANLKNTSCNFNFVFKTWVDNDPDLKKGFWDEKILTNTLTSGNW